MLLLLKIETQHIQAIKYLILRGVSSFYLCFCIYCNACIIFFRLNQLAITCEHIPEKQNPIKTFTHDCNGPSVHSLYVPFCICLFLCICLHLHIFIGTEAFNLRGMSEISYNHMKERMKEWRRDKWRTNITALIWMSASVLYRLHWIDGGWQSMVFLWIALFQNWWSLLST